MSVVKERIILRKRRREGEKMPHRIKLDAVGGDDSLLVEIVVDKNENLVYRYLFQPQQLAGRRGITFRESGNEIYWLSGLKPKMLLQQQAEALTEQSEQKKTNVRSEREPVNRKVLVFGEYGSLVAVYRTLKDVTRVMNLREEAVDKLCRTKRASSETGFSFRYWWKVLDFDITDFTLTLSRYDELCKRKPAPQD